MRNWLHKQGDLWSAGVLCHYERRKTRTAILKSFKYSEVMLNEKWKKEVSKKGKRLGYKQKNNWLHKQGDLCHY